MIDREHDLPIVKQAEILKVSRGSVYYLPRPVSQPISKSCSVLIGCTWSFPSPVRVCCEACWLSRGARSAAGM